MTMEDTLVMIDELGIEHGYDVNMEKTLGRRLRSEVIYMGRTLKEGHPEFGRPGLKKLIEKLGEKPGQLILEDWVPQAVLPTKYLPKS